jgi:chemotaxis protein CheD
MAVKTVGIAELLVSDHVDDTLVTYSLGSCLGLAVWDPLARCGGLLHSFLPLSNTDPDRARDAPATFTDTGVVALLEAVLGLGASKPRLVAKAVGCANMIDDDRYFRVGERNYTVLRKVLWRNGILIAAEEVGGTMARTLVLHIGSGRAQVRAQGQRREI